MRITICAVGRLRKGPEKALIDDYVARFDKIGRALALGPITITEVEAKKSGMAGEAALLERAIPEGSYRIILDERGTVMPSPKFSQQIAALRDDGQRDVTFIIGGADGLEPEFRTRAQASLSFGKMVWPHMLVRVMLAEQLYRAASILTGSPYHRV